MPLIWTYPKHPEKMLAQFSLLRSLKKEISTFLWKFGECLPFNSEREGPWDPIPHPQTYIFPQYMWCGVKMVDTEPVCPVSNLGNCRSAMYQVGDPRTILSLPKSIFWSIKRELGLKPLDKDFKKFNGLKMCKVFRAMAGSWSILNE